MRCMTCAMLPEYGWRKEGIMDVSERVQSAIDYCYELIEDYDNNIDITDVEICELIEILRGR